MGNYSGVACANVRGAVHLLSLDVFTAAACAYCPATRSSCIDELPETTSARALSARNISAASSSVSTRGTCGVANRGQCARRKHGFREHLELEPFAATAMAITRALLTAMRGRPNRSMAGKRFWDGIWAEGPRGSVNRMAGAVIERSVRPARAAVYALRPNHRTADYLCCQWRDVLREAVPPSREGMTPAEWRRSDPE